MEGFSDKKFTPAEDLRLLFTRCEHPQASWIQIAEIFKKKFKVIMSPPLLKYRFEHYLNIPGLKKDQLELMNYPFLSGPKTPEDYMSLYRQILDYHGRTAASKREAGFQKQAIKKALYPNFEQTLTKFQQEAVKLLGLSNMEQEYELLQSRPTEQLNQQQATRLQKIQKIYFRTKQLKLENHKKITKIHRIIRNIIEAEMKGFCEDVTINQINVDKYLFKTVRNIYHNCSKLAKKIIEKQLAQQRIKQEGRRQAFYMLAKQKGSLMNSQRTQKNWAGHSKQPVKIQNNYQEEQAISSNYFLQDFSVIEKHYLDSKEPLFRKDIIKLYYFPQDKPEGPEPKLYETSDGQSITLKRLVTILKMFKKIQITQLKARQREENELRQEIESLQKNSSAPFQCDISSIGIKNQGKQSKATYMQLLQACHPLTKQENPEKAKKVQQSHKRNPPELQMVPAKKKTMPAISRKIDAFDPQKQKSIHRPRKHSEWNHSNILDELTEDLQIIDENEYRCNTSISKELPKTISPQPSGQETIMQDLPRRVKKEPVRYNYHLSSLDKSINIKGISSGSSNVSPFELVKSPSDKKQTPQHKQTYLHDWVNNKQGQQTKKIASKRPRVSKKNQGKKESPIHSLADLVEDSQPEEKSENLPKAEAVQPASQDYRSYLMTVLGSEMQDKSKVGRPSKARTGQ